MNFSCEAVLEEKAIRLMRIIKVEIERVTGLDLNKLFILNCDCVCCLSLTQRLGGYGIPIQTSSLAACRKQHASRPCSRPHKKNYKILQMFTIVFKTLDTCVLRSNWSSC
jgi:hypothetical protein